MDPRLLAAPAPRRAAVPPGWTLAAGLVLLAGLGLRLHALSRLEGGLNAREARLGLAAFPAPPGSLAPLPAPGAARRPAPEEMLAGWAGHLLGPTPAALRLTALLLAACFLAGLWSAGRRAAGPAGGLAALALAATGPPALVWLNLTPWPSANSLLAAGAVLCAAVLAGERDEREGRRRLFPWFAAGALGGLCLALPPAGWCLAVPALAWLALSCPQVLPRLRGLGALFFFLAGSSPAWLPLFLGQGWGFAAPATLRETFLALGQALGGWEGLGFLPGPLPALIFLLPLAGWLARRQERPAGAGCAPWCLPVLAAAALGCGRPAGAEAAAASLVPLAVAFPLLAGAGVVRLGQKRPAAAVAAVLLPVLVALGGFWWPGSQARIRAHPFLALDEGRLLAPGSTLQLALTRRGCPSAYAPPEIAACLTLLSGRTTWCAPWPALVPPGDPAAAAESPLFACPASRAAPLSAALIALGRERFREERASRWLLVGAAGWPPARGAELAADRFEIRGASGARWPELQDGDAATALPVPPGGGLLRLELSWRGAAATVSGLVLTPPPGRLLPARLRLQAGEAGATLVELEAAGGLWPACWSGSRPYLGPGVGRLELHFPPRPVERLSLTLYGGGELAELAPLGEPVPAEVPAAGDWLAAASALEILQPGLALADHQGAAKLARASGGRLPAAGPGEFLAGDRPFFVLPAGEEGPLAADLRRLGFRPGEPRRAGRLALLEESFFQFSDTRAFPAPAGKWRPGANGQSDVLEISLPSPRLLEGVSVGAERETPWRVLLAADGRTFAPPPEPRPTAPRRFFFNGRRVFACPEPGRRAEWFQPVWARALRLEFGRAAGAPAAAAAAPEVELWGR